MSGLRTLQRSVVKTMGSPQSLRTMLGLHQGGIRLRSAPAPFSVVTYNLALMIFPATYRGPGYFRSQVIDEVCQRLDQAQADVVGLCEVWDPDERWEIRRRLAELYPHAADGPDEADLEAAGGLLLLSRHPTLKRDATIYRACAKADCFANKGALHFRIAPPSLSTPVDLFFTHAQAVYRGGDGRAELCAQLVHLNRFVQANRDPEYPSFVFGDLNISDMDTDLFTYAHNVLEYPIDLWRARNGPPDRGCTNVADNNFYEDDDDDSRPPPGGDARLDYILMHPGDSFFPLLNSMDVLKWTRNGRQISDHFGLRAAFESGVTLIHDPRTIPIRVAVSLVGFHCLEESDEVGDDSVFFDVEIRGSTGEKVHIVTPTVEGVYTGKIHLYRDPPLLTLSGDPGSLLQIGIMGTEEDITDHDWLGNKEITLLRSTLLHHLGQVISRTIGLLDQDGGEYAVMVEIRATEASG